MKISLVSKFACHVTLLVGLLAAACGGGSPQAGNAQGQGNGPEGQGQPEEPAIAVRVAGVVREPIASLYSTSATLRADRQATVIARTRGVIERLAVEEGDKVTAGEALAYLEDDEQKIAAARARTTEEAARREHERLSGHDDVVERLGIKVRQPGIKICLYDVDT